MVNPNLRILIVDDEKPNLMVLSDLLQNEAQITLANNGKRAIEKAQELQPDIILLDVVMPEVSGFDVIKALKANKLTRSIPVIFITGLGDVKSEEKGFELGACDYIQKPFHLGIVKARVKLHLTIARQCIMLEKLANIDPLTAIPNRRKFSERVENEWAGAKRNRNPIVLAMVDVDKFKQYNDQYGHAAGDNVLTQVAKTLQTQLKRPRDFIARYGGEEFVIIINETDQISANAILEKCRSAVQNLNIKNEASPHACITVSIGAAICTPSSNISANALLEQADHTLYQAKETGRNKLAWSA